MESPRLSFISSEKQEKNLVCCEGFILNCSCGTSAAATLDSGEESEAPDAPRHFITCKMLNASFPSKEALSFPVSVLLFAALKGKSEALVSCLTRFLCVFRETVVQECEGGLQPAAQAGKQTGTTCQTWGPGEFRPGATPHTASRWRLCLLPVSRRLHLLLFV